VHEKLYLIGGNVGNGKNEKVFSLKSDGSDWEEEEHLTLDAGIDEHGVFAYNII